MCGTFAWIANEVLGWKACLQFGCWVTLTTANSYRNEDNLSMKMRKFPQQHYGVLINLTPSYLKTVLEVKK